MKREKLFFIINIVFFVLISVGNLIFTGQGGIGPLPSLAVKGITSGMFALLGILNVLFAALSGEKKLKMHVSIAVGLVFAMLGDIFLGYNFALGAGLFALGHVLYFIGYSFYQRLCLRDLIFGIAIFAAAAFFIFLCPLLDFGEPFMKWVCVAYAFIISFMLGKALSNLIAKPCKLSGIMALGATLFFFSDLMLVFDWFIGLWDITGDLCMATYYPAQWLIAFSLFFAARRRKAK